MGTPTLLALSLLLIPVLGAPGLAAPKALADADALARWLGRDLRRARDPAELETRDGWALAGTPEVVDPETARLAQATVSYGPLRFEGAVTVTRVAGEVSAELDFTRWAVAGTALGAARGTLRWARTEGWTGRVTARLGDGVVAVQVAPRLRPQRCRRGQVCPPDPLRLTVEVVGVQLAQVVGLLAEDARGPWAALQGELAGVVRLGGEPADLAVDGALTWAARWDGEPLGTLALNLLRAGEHPELEVVAALAGPLARELSLTARVPVRVDGEALALRIHGQRPWAGRLAVQGARLEAWTAAFPVLGLGGLLDLEAELDGQDLRLEVNGDGLRWAGEAVGAVALHSHLHGGVAQGSLRWGPRDAAVASLGFSVPLDLDPAAPSLTWRHREPLRLSLRAQGLTPERLRPFWRAHPAADFTVDLQVDAEGPLGALAGDGRLTGTLADGDHAPLPLAAALKVRPEAQRLEASVGRAVILELGTELPLLAWREGRFHPGQAAVAGALGLAVPLSTAAPYLPGDLHDPQGQLDGRFTVAGSLARPAFAGQATLEGGAVTVIAGHQRLRALTVRLTAADTRLTIERLAAASGVGTWAGSGHLELAASPEGDPTAVPLWSAWALTTALDLTARRVPFLHPLVSAGLADGHVAVHSVQRPGDTQATVTVDGARVDLTAIRMPPAQAIPHNGRIQVVDWAGRARGPERLFVGDDHLALTVALAEPVTVEGDGVRLRIGGTLALDRTAERAEVTGGFDVLEGEFSLFENPFTLRRGRISLQGGPLVTVEGDLTAETARLRDPDAPPKAAALEPIFDWLAEGEVVGTYVDLAIRGPARRPELILASDPPLPEYRILTLLVTGRVDAVDGRNGDVRRQVAKLVDRFHNPSLSRQLYDRLGVDKLGLKFQSLSQPVLTVGKQVNRQLYVETVYHHNAPPDENEKEARVEYRLDPSWTLDTAYGDAAVGSVGVFWKRDFGGPAPQRKATRPLAEAPERAAED